MQVNNSGAHWSTFSKLPNYILKLIKDYQKSKQKRGDPPLKVLSPKLDDPKEEIGFNLGYNCVITGHYKHENKL